MPAKFIHGYTHAPDGTDPIPASTGAAVYGEAYKTANQTITNQSATKLTSWASWVTPNTSYIDQSTNGLDVLVTGYYAVMGYAGMTTGGGVTTQFTASVEWSPFGGDNFVDRIHSVPVQDYTGLDGGLDTYVNGIALITAPATVNLFFYHVTSASGSRVVTDAFIRLALIGTA